jgi:hypothetical protein
MRFALLFVACVSVTAACGAEGSSGGPEAPPSERQDGLGPSSPEDVTVEACPVDDSDACDALTAGAIAILSDNAEELTELSRPQRWPCNEFADVLPTCTEQSAISGFTLAAANPPLEVLSRSDYTNRLAMILGGASAEYSDEHGDGSLRLLGVNTCEEPDPDDSSHHLAYTFASARDGEPPERWVATFEFAKSGGRWQIGIAYADAVAAWETRFADPLSEIGCGTIEAWRTP